MSTEDALREKIAEQLNRVRGFGFADTPEEGQDLYDISQDALRDADAALNAIGIPLSVLSWCRANPDTAAALAAGTMVALDREMSGRAWSALRGAFTAKAAQWAAFDQYEKSAQYADRVPEDLYAIVLAAVSPPASDEGQGGKLDRQSGQLHAGHYDHPDWLTGSDGD